MIKSKTVLLHCNDRISKQYFQNKMSYAIIERGVRFEPIRGGSIAKGYEMNNYVAWLVFKKTLDRFNDDYFTENIKKR